MKKIDFENHFYDISTIDGMAKREIFPKYDRERDVIHWNSKVEMPQGILLKKLLDIGEGRLQLMDAYKIDTAIISTAQGVEDLAPVESIDLCRKTNDAVYALTQEYPGRYLGSAILPVKDVKAAEAELERCIKELGFVCWHTHSNYAGAAPFEDRFRPLFRKAAELGVFVYLHPGFPESESLHDFGFTFGGPAAGFTVDTMLSILKMIVSGLFDELPTLKVILGHLGEAIPFLLDRIDNRMNFLPNPALKNQQKPSYYFHNNIMVSTSGNMSPAAFRCTQDVLGIQNIVFGSDYPFESLPDMVNFVDSLPISDEERAMVYSGNAARLGIT
ncbi:MAG: amidohydrolase family protein [Saccharofermentanales bacterium]